MWVFASPCLFVIFTVSRFMVRDDSVSDGFMNRAATPFSLISYRLCLVGLNWRPWWSQISHAYRQQAGQLNPFCCTYCTENERRGEPQNFRQWATSVHNEGYTNRHKRVSCHVLRDPINNTGKRSRSLTMYERDPGLVYHFPHYLFSLNRFLFLSLKEKKKALAPVNFAYLFAILNGEYVRI